MNQTWRLGAGAGVCLVLLAGCGGGDDAAGPAPTPQAVETPTSFAAYAAGDGEGSAQPDATLLPAQATELGERTRKWAASAIGGSEGNAFVVPPLHFARVEAVAAAASGSTLAQLRAVTPAPSREVVGAAMLRGLERTVSAASDFRVAPAYMRSVTAAGQRGVWSALVLQPLPASVQADQSDLRLGIADRFRVDIAWPAAAVVDGVYEDATGQRQIARLLRLDGRTVAWPSAAGADVVALALPGQRWLLRLTPAAGLAAWPAAGLAAAIGDAQSRLAGQAGAPGRLVLPMQDDFASAGFDDVSGMDEALNERQADLRALDGRGGTYARPEGGAGRLALTSAGLTLDASAGVSFLFSAENPWSGGSGTTLVNPPFWWQTYACGATELKPAHFVLLGRDGRVELLARFAQLAAQGSYRPCSG